MALEKQSILVEVERQRVGRKFLLTREGFEGNILNFIFIPFSLRSFFLFINQFFPQAAQDGKATLEKDIQLLKEKEEKMTKAKCTEVFKQTFACYS